MINFANQTCLPQPVKQGTLRDLRWLAVDLKVKHTYHVTVSGCSKL